MNRYEWAKTLLEEQIVMVRPEEPFRWTSGLLSPIYCDNRQLISIPSLRKEIAQDMAAWVEELQVPVHVIAGTATAGIPYAAWLAERLELPMIYVRSQAKGHGLGRQIEGRLAPGANVLVVEDLISTGKSSWQSIDAVKGAGAHPLGVVSIFQYGFPPTLKRFADAGLDCYSLTDLSTLLEVLQASGEWQAEALATVDAWKEDPWAWTAAREGGAR